MAIFVENLKHFLKNSGSESSWNTSLRRITEVLLIQSTNPIFNLSRYWCWYIYHTEMYATLVYIKIIWFPNILLQPTSIKSIEPQSGQRKGGTNVTMKGILPENFTVTADNQIINYTRFVVIPAKRFAYEHLTIAWTGSRYVLCGWHQKHTESLIQTSF